VVMEAWDGGGCWERLACVRTNDRGGAYVAVLKE